MKAMDRLTNLPDQIRNHIFSFLPTKDALQTSVLSSQWRYISSSLPNLQFKHWELKPDNYNQNFRNGVYNLLSFREKVDLQALYLGVYMNYHYVTLSDLRNWINTALKYRLQKFYLDADYNDTVVLPDELFECDLLRNLIFVNFSLGYPSRVRLSNLRSLVLYGIYFPDYKGIDDVDLVNKLFQLSSLPVLKNLEVRFCPQIYTLCISIPSLLNLKMDSYHRHKRVFVSIPSLRRIEYSGIDVGYLVCPVQVCSKTLASLQSGKFEFPPNLNPSTDASDILFGLCNVESLWLNASFIESLSGDQLFFGKKPVLAATPKLLRLEIYRTKKQTQVISFLSKCFPKLQAIYIDSLDTTKDKVAEEEFVLASDFKLEDVSKLPRLRRIEFNYFGGTEAELDLLLCLLQRASDSTKVNISYNADLNESQITDIKKLLKLAGLPI